MEPQQVLPLQVKVDLEVMAMKEYSSLHRSPEQMLFSVIPRIPLLGRVLPLCRGYSQHILRYTEWVVDKLIQKLMNDNFIV